MYSTLSVTGSAADNGGLVGICSTCTITGSYATGDVSGTFEIGGLIGRNSGGSISTSYATGNITGSSFRVGGFVGRNSGGSVTNAYATGNVAGTTSVGGFAGDGGLATLTNVYSIGTVTGTASVGGLMGSTSGGATTASFWDTTTSGTIISAAGTGKTTEEMKTQTTFSDAGWNFSTIWGIAEGLTYPYFGFSPGITITESAGTTSVTEAGDTDTFTVVLNSAMSSDVVLSVVSGGIDEATISPATLTFTPLNWNDAQTITVTGVDDAIVDGDQISTITIAITDGSSDDTYDSVVDETVSVTTIDDGEPQPVSSANDRHSTSGTQFGCQDPIAINYKAQFVKHKQELCRYDTPETVKKSIETTVQNSTCPFFSNYYRLGDRGEGVKRVQIFLSGKGFNSGIIDGIYGRQTNEAVKQFQSNYFDEVLKPWNLSKPTGYLYQSTRHKMNELAGCEEGEVKLDNGVIIK